MIVQEEAAYQAKIKKREEHKVGKEALLMVYVVVDIQVKLVFVSHFL